MTGVGAKHLIKKSLRATELWVVRESDEHDQQMFSGMRDLTYQPHRHRPEIEAIREVGMAPWHCESYFYVEYRGKRMKVLVETIDLPGAPPARLFSFEGVWHLWSMASAAKMSIRGINEFTRLLVKVLQMLRPRVVRAANVSRLVRSKAQGSILEAALHLCVESVWAGDTVFRFDGDDTGPMMFSMFATVAAAERNWIVQRLLTGRIAKWRRGEWAFGRRYVPFGYVYDEDTKKLSVDPELVEKVRAMLEILSEELPPAEMQRRLSAAGVNSIRRGKGGVTQDVGLVADPTSLLDSMYAWAPIWVAGEYLFRHRNGFPKLDELNGVPIVRHDDTTRPLAGDDVDSEEDEDGAYETDLEIHALLEATGNESADALDALLCAIEESPEDAGELQMLHKLPLPEGGWATDDVLERFAKAATRWFARTDRQRNPARPLALTVQSSSGVPELHASLLPPMHAHGNDDLTHQWRAYSRSRRLLTPFLGRGWVDGQHYYELTARGVTHYRLVRWPLPAEYAYLATASHDDTQEGRDSPSTRPDERSDHVGACEVVELPLWGGSQTVDRARLDHSRRENVADFPLETISHGFVRAFAGALRDGVPLQHLLGQSMFTDPNLVTTVRTIESRRTELNRKLEDALESAAHATRLATQPGIRDEKRDMYDAQADQNFAAAERHRTALANLDREEREPAPPVRTLTTQLATLHVAASALVANTKVSQAAYQALVRILTRFRLRRGPDGVWQAEVYAILNVSEGAAELGPVTWPVGFGGRAVPRATLRVTVPSDAPLTHPRKLRRQLVETGKVNEAAVKVLMKAPFKQLPYLVLHGLGHPLPAWITGRWRDPDFVAWITKVYTDKDLIWYQTRNYSMPHPLRQLIMHLAAESERPVTADAVRKVVWLPTNAPIFRSAWRTKESAFDPEFLWWNPTVCPVDFGRWADGGTRTRSVTAVRCLCGRAARVLAKVPEVPRHVLCECGRMPDAAAHGVPPDLRFPEEYQVLMQSKDACVAELTEAWAKAATSAGTRLGQTFRLRGALTRGATNDELAAAVGVQIGQMRSYTRSLETLGLLRWRHPSKRDHVHGHSKIWSYTEEGLARVERLAPSHEAS